MNATVKKFENVLLSGNLEKDIELFQNIFKKEAFFRVKRIKVRNTVSFDCAVLYFDGMINSAQLDDGVIRPLLIVDIENDSQSLADFVETQILFIRDVKKQTKVSDMLNGIMFGEALILIDSSTESLSVETKGFKIRGIDEPQDERVLAGPREGFVENALSNISLIRRKLQTPDLCSEIMRVGTRSNTQVYICYLESLADSKLVESVKEKIRKINIDGILDSNYITENIRDHKYSLFKTTGTTERPDIVAAKLLEGRIAIIVNGTPMVVTLPYLFSENFQSDEDYYLNFLVSSVGRVLRYISFFLAVSIPAIFIALSSFHRELLPTALAVSIANLRGGVPFAPLTECLIMIFVFEILKETGVRMPESLGHALSIVGGLVVGQAAVEARIISTPMLIVIAVSGIAGLMIPRLRGAVFYLRLLFVFLSAFFGLLGFFCGAAITVMHIISLNSFGVDYNVSLKKADFQSLKDTFWRTSWVNMIQRPRFNRNLIRSRKEK
ncbi:MAG: spore germination protein [Clostridia bacterium]|nr:spore germination protein [Clostridia bacterium]